MAPGFPRRAPAARTAGVARFGGTVNTRFARPGLRRDLTEERQAVDERLDALAGLAEDLQPESMEGANTNRARREPIADDVPPRRPMPELRHHPRIVALILPTMLLRHGPGKGHGRN